MSPRLSETIRFLRFPLIVALILLHSATAASYADKSIYGAVVYPFAFWLGETVVPSFFFISGLLFFLSRKSYAQKLHSRIDTLVIPYLSWNMLQLLFFLLLMLAGIQAKIGGVPMSEVSPWEMLKGIIYTDAWDHGNATPLFSHFWYIRNLIVLCLLGPVIEWCTKWGRWIFVVLLFLIWNADHSSALLMESIFFFSLGAYAARQEKALDTLPDEKGKGIIILGALLFVADLLTHTIVATQFSLTVHRLALTVNIPLLFVVADRLCRHATWAPRISKLEATTFWIFAVHYPLVIYSRRWIVSHTANSPEIICILLYFACAALVLTVSLASHWLMKKLMPRTLSFITGNRL